MARMQTIKTGVTVNQFAAPEDVKSKLCAALGFDPGDTMRILIDIQPGLPIEVYCVDVAFWGARRRIHRNYEGLRES
jgi:hypothetical protein